MPGTVRPPPEDIPSSSPSPEPAPAGPTVPEALPASLLHDRPKICPTCGVRYPVEFNVCPKDATGLADAEAPDDDDLVGETLAQTYTILRVLGEGGMGRVYEARHTRIGSKRFAVKVLHPEFARVPEVLSRFQREAESAASIRSAHVVDVYDVHKTPDGRPYIVGELLEGRELAEHVIQSGPLPHGIVVRVGRQICRALGAAHAGGIIHRDMKPENVFLTGDLARPHAKVIDFGISKAADAVGSSLTKTGMIMGTPSYMAPEQARGERVDFRADIYAVGAVLYCAATGVRPFDRNDPTATLAAVLTEEPRRPREIEPSIPEKLELIIQRAMAKEPGDRYPSIDDLEADLAEVDDDERPSLTRDPMPSASGVARTAMVRSSTSVEVARPTMIVLGGLAAFFVLGSLLSIIAGAVRLARGGDAGANLTSFEGGILIALLTLALATPASVAGLWVKRRIWSNSAKTLELTDALRRVLFAVFIAYGSGSLFVRVLESVVLRRAVGVAWPVWDVVLAATALVAGGFVVLGLKRETRARR